MFTSRRFFERFFVIFVVKFVISNRKIIEKLQVLLVFQRCRSFRVRVLFDVHFCFTLVSFCVKMGTKSTKMVIKSSIEISIDFLIDFLTILFPFGDPCWRPLVYFGV